MMKQVIKFSIQGIDLGSNSFKNITIPKIGLIVGDGVTSYDASQYFV